MRVKEIIREKRRFERGRKGEQTPEERKEKTRSARER